MPDAFSCSRGIPQCLMVDYKSAIQPSVPKNPTGHGHSEPSSYFPHRSSAQGSDASVEYPPQPKTIAAITKKPHWYFNKVAYLRFILRFQSLLLQFLLFLLQITYLILGLCNFTIDLTDLLEKFVFRGTKGGLLFLLDVIGKGGGNRLNLRIIRARLLLKQTKTKML